MQQYYRAKKDAGDALLRAVVARIRSSVRDNDLICRWGGDEFAILFLGMAEDTFVDVARRTCESGYNYIFAKNLLGELLGKPQDVAADD